jgi:hypothetical protein
MLNGIFWRVPKVQKVLEVVANEVRQGAEASKV